MANRPVFVVCDKSPYYSEYNAEFVWAGGLSVSQNRKNVDAIHQCFTTKFPEKKALEISSKSTEEWGVGASAFNLKKFVPSLNGTVYVENIYQSSKVFAGGGPYVDLLKVAPIDAKRDERLKHSGRLTSFRFEDIDYPLEPETAFYDFIYINALLENKDIAEKLKEYDGFTDIAFNPAKGVNCQARAAAIFVSLSRNGLIDKVKDFKSFVSLFGTSSRPGTVIAALRDPAEEPKDKAQLHMIEKGDFVIHKIFGKGTIISVTASTLKAQFPSVGEKTLGLAWVRQNCEIGKE